MAKSLKVQGLLLIFICALCWGPSYLFIKVAVPEIPPLSLVFLRVAIGFAIIFAVCARKKLKVRDWKHHWKEFLFLGLTMNVIPNALINYGEMYIASSLAGILNSFTVIFTVILSLFLGVRETLTKSKALGIGLGILGLGAIYLPDLRSDGFNTGLGSLLVLLATLSYAIGGIFARTHMQKNIPALVILAIQLGLASLVLIPLSLIIEHPFALPLPSLEATLSAIGLGVIGTAGGFYFYYKAIHLAGATYASLSVFIVPIFAMILGALILGETITWNIYLGAALILIGVAAVNPAFKNK